MLQIYTDSKVESSKDAQLFIKALIRECRSQGVEIVLTGVINTGMPFVLPTPNTLTANEMALLRDSQFNCELYFNIANTTLDGVYRISQYIEFMQNYKSTIAIFGGSGKVATELYEALKEDVHDLEIEDVYLISSTTPLHDVAEIVKKSNIIISAIPFGKELVSVDLYHKYTPKVVFDLSNSLSHSKDKCGTYVSYRKLGNRLTESIVKYARYKERG